MIKLFGFGSSLGVPDPSSFVMKVDAYLRMASLDYTYLGSMDYMKQAPKGKLPFLELDGEKIADSEFIINALDKRFDEPLNNWLSLEQKALVYLAAKSLDENLYWCLVYSRWFEEKSWQYIKASFFGSLPPVVRDVVPAMIRNKIKKKLTAHGMGCHSPEEVLAIAEQSFSALSDLLGDKRYFFGERLCNFDAVAFGMLCEFILSEADSRFCRAAKEHPNLVAYCNRIAVAYYTNEFKNIPKESQIESEDHTALTPA